MNARNGGRPRGLKLAGPLVRWAGWVKAGILAGLTKMEGDTLAVIAAHEGQDGSYPSVPTIAKLTGHKASRLYSVLKKLVTMRVLARVGSIRYAGARGSRVVSYSVTKPPAQGKAFQPEKPLSHGEAFQEKASPSGAEKPPPQRPESLPSRGRQSVLRSVKEVGDAPSASPLEAASLASPGAGRNGDDALESLRTFWRIVGGDVTLFRSMASRAGNSAEAIEAIVLEHQRPQT